MKKSLRLFNLSYVRAGRALFQDLSFELSAGQGLLLYGPNGAGKSSLLRLLAGFLLPSAGKIYWENQELQEASLAYHQALHFLGHQAGVKNRLTVKENLLYSQSLFDYPPDEGKLQAVLDSLQLLSLKDRLVQHLSAGQKRRLALARLFAFPKPLWILDEPFTNLDDACQRWFYERLEEHLQKAGLVVLASHQPFLFQHKTFFQTLFLPLENRGLPADV